MFYETIANKHGLKHDPFKALVAPRPIGWIATLSAKGEVNLAPYSYFNAFSSVPPIVGFSSEGDKDSSTFAMETREFVWSMATWDLRDRMNATSEGLPRGRSEFEFAGPNWTWRSAKPPSFELRRYHILLAESKSPMVSEPSISQSPAIGSQFEFVGPNRKIRSSLPGVFELRRWNTPATGS